MDTFWAKFLPWKMVIWRTCRLLLTWIYLIAVKQRLELQKIDSLMGNNSDICTWNRFGDHGSELIPGLGGVLAPERPGAAVQPCHVAAEGLIFGGADAPGWATGLGLTAATPKTDHDIRSFKHDKGIHLMGWGLNGNEGCGQTQCVNKDSCKMRCSFVFGVAIGCFHVLGRRFSVSLKLCLGRCLADVTVKHRGLTQWQREGLLDD